MAKPTYLIEQLVNAARVVCGEFYATGTAVENLSEALKAFDDHIPGWTPESMTNSQEIATSSLANYEIAIKSVVTGASAAHMFEVGTMTLPSGNKWDVTVCVLSEPARKLIEPLIRHGIPGMSESYAKMIPSQIKGEPN